MRANYDEERSYTRDRIAQLSFDELVYGSADRFDIAASDDFVLVDDRVVWGPTRDTRQFLLERLGQLVRADVPAGGSVVEFGSGSGRNLMYLKRCFPDRSFVGLELSPVSVDLARQLAHRFGLDVSFHTCNVCEPLPVIPELRGGATLAFSSHALEMMPRIFRGAVMNMLAVARDVVAFLEPVPELWSNDVRGWTGRARVIVHDRLRGLMPALRSSAQNGWAIDRATRMRFSTNPLNETCQIVLRRRG